MTAMHEIYSRLLSDPANRYGFGDHWKPVWQAMLSAKPASMLDVGCGRGGLVQALQVTGCPARGCDVAPCEPWIDRAELPSLPYADGDFDLVGCFDVLEHVHEAQVDAAIRELLRVCGRILFVSVAECSDARVVPGMGRVELHLTRRPVAWWLSALGAGARIVPVRGEPAWRHYLTVDR